MSSQQLRPYQVKAIQDIRGHYLNGTRKVLLHLATGGGKTLIFSEIVKKTAAKGKKCIIVVRGRKLVDQASQRLIREGVDHGVKMNGHWNKNERALVQVCSIDTLSARNEYPEADLVVIDEAHLFTSDISKEFIKKYEKSFVLAVTATPYTDEPLCHIADKIVYPITIKELISDNYLLPPKYFAPSAPNLRGVHIRSGDYVLAELEKRMGVLTHDLPGHWKKLAENRPTICFAVNIMHSKSIVEQFNASGIPAEHIEANFSLEEREKVIKRLVSGEIKVVSNVGILCTGVDIPPVSCILMARPTRSYNLYIQQCGRGTRVSENKKDFIILDHASNILRHGFITTEREVYLVPNKEKENSEIDLGLIKCEECFLVFSKDDECCPDCGWIVPKSGDSSAKTIYPHADPLTELKEMPVELEAAIFCKQHIKVAKLKGYKRGWAFHKTKEKYGEEIAQKVYPKSRFKAFT